MRGQAAALAALAAAALAGCGAESVVPGIGNDEDTAQGKRVKAVVQQFAAADGPEACDLLTPAALRKVYGAKEPPGPPPEITDPPPAISLAECRRRAVRFSGAKVEVKKIDFQDSGAARVDATTDGGERTYSVTVRRRGDAWLIDEITEK